jgi:hypothetical protein
MRKVQALMVASVIALGTATPARALAGSATDVALGLSAFAVFNQLWPQLTGPRSVSGPQYPGVIAPVVAPGVPAAGVMAAPTLTYPTTIAYPHGHYELRGNGVTIPYYWVWVPTVPPAPPAQPGAPPTAAPPGN